MQKKSRRSTGEVDTYSLCSMDSLRTKEIVSTVAHTVHNNIRTQAFPPFHLSADSISRTLVANPDPHNSGNPHPDRHQREKPIQLRIRIKVKSRIRIRIKVKRRIRIRTRSTTVKIRTSVQRQLIIWSSLTTNFSFNLLSLAPRRV